MTAYWVTSQVKKFGNIQRIIPLPIRFGFEKGDMLHVFLSYEEEQTEFSSDVHTAGRHRYIILHKGIMPKVRVGDYVHVRYIFEAIPQRPGEDSDDIL